MPNQVIFMKRNSLQLALILLLLFFSISPVSAVYEGEEGGSNQLPTPEFVQNEVIVKYKKNQSPVSLQTLGTNSQQFQSLIAFNEDMGVINTQIVELSYTKSDLVVYKTGGEKSVEQLVNSYNTRPEVEYAQPNYILKTMKTPNDTSYSQLWGLEKIKAPAAWDETTGSKTVLAADIDTGTDSNHPDLKNNIVDHISQLLRHFYWSVVSGS